MLTAMNGVTEQLKQKSAVSAAFELCVAMEPKARPKFEFKDGKKTTGAVSERGRYER